jgi:heme/copper-type cytochrome/quinol oxidase subunit 3
VFCVNTSQMRTEQPIDIKRKNRLLMVCYVPATSATFLAFFSFFLAVAINSTNETNKAVGTCHSSVYLSLMSMVQPFL